MEKIKAMEAEKKEQEDIIDTITEMEKDEKTKTHEFNTDYICEVCMLEMESKLNLMEHYSNSHMAFNLKEKFEHLVDNGQCKICKFEEEEEHLLFIHIGTLHEKVNVVLKENGLKPVGDKIAEDKEKTNQADIKDSSDKMHDIEKQALKLTQ